MYVALYKKNSFEFVDNVGVQLSIRRDHKIVDYAMHTFTGRLYVAQNPVISMYIDILHTLFMVYSIGLHK
jgi:hypothetical protein